MNQDKCNNDEQQIMSSIDFSCQNRMIISKSSPDENVVIDEKGKKLLWQKYPKAVLLRYTNGFDATDNQDWYYVIKDSPFDINCLKAKRRYVINQGTKNFEVRRIDPHNYSQELYSVMKESFMVYPAKYRPAIPQINDFVNSLIGEGQIFAAFFRENGLLCGYSVVVKNGKCLKFIIQKTRPSFEKYQVNAALVNAILDDNKDLLASGYYISDGSKNVYHETNFQDYLIKYFNFRKAYCDLHVVFNPRYKFILNALYAFRKLFYKLDSISIVHKLNAILKLKEFSVE